VLSKSNNFERRESLSRVITVLITGEIVMEINHAPVFDEKRIEDLYSKKDGIAVKYVCTTDLLASDLPVDIFYRETPHPEFGNRYFGIYKNPFANDAKVMITNADAIETSGRYQFGMVQDKDGKYWYSRSHHECLFLDGNMIDGGREYVRATGEVTTFRVKNGELLIEEAVEFPDFVENFDFS
jgi:hypothetical protein|tara:strand:+ start:1765 stop:2313 length:549 start_codon:yes stop_codon:yes gene_type:complete